MANNTEMLNNVENSPASAKYDEEYQLCCLRNQTAHSKQLMAKRKEKWDDLIKKIEGYDYMTEDDENDGLAKLLYSEEFDALTRQTGLVGDAAEESPDSLSETLSESSTADCITKMDEIDTLEKLELSINMINFPTEDTPMPMRSKSNPNSKFKSASIDTYCLDNGNCTVNKCINREYDIAVANKSPAKINSITKCSYVDQVNKPNNDDAETRSGESVETDILEKFCSQKKNMTITMSRSFAENSIENNDAKVKTSSDKINKHDNKDAETISGESVETEILEKFSSQKKNMSISMSRSGEKNSTANNDRNVKTSSHKINKRGKEHAETRSNESVETDILEKFCSQKKYMSISMSRSGAKNSIVNIDSNVKTPSDKINKHDTKDAETRSGKSVKTDILEKFSSQKKNMSISMSRSCAKNSTATNDSNVKTSNDKINKHDNEDAETISGDSVETEILEKFCSQKKNMAISMSRSCAKNSTANNDSNVKTSNDKINKHDNEDAETISGYSAETVILEKFCSQKKNMAISMSRSCAKNSTANNDRNVKTTSDKINKHDNKDAETISGDSAETDILEKFCSQKKNMTITMSRSCAKNSTATNDSNVKTPYDKINKHDTKDAETRSGESADTDILEKFCSQKKNMTFSMSRSCAINSTVNNVSNVKTPYDKINKHDTKDAETRSGESADTDILEKFCSQKKNMTITMSQSFAKNSTANNDSNVKTSSDKIYNDGDENAETRSGESVETDILEKYCSQKKRMSIAMSQSIAKNITANNDSNVKTPYDKFNKHDDENAETDILDTFYCTKNMTRTTRQRDASKCTVVPDTYMRHSFKNKSSKYRTYNLATSSSESAETDILETCLMTKKNRKTIFENVANKIPKNVTYINKSDEENVYDAEAENTDSSCSDDAECSGNATKSMKHGVCNNNSADNAISNIPLESLKNVTIPISNTCSRTNSPINNSKTKIAAGDNKDTVISHTTQTFKENLHITTDVQKNIVSNLTNNHHLANNITNITTTEKIDTAGIKSILQELDNTFTKIKSNEIEFWIHTKMSPMCYEKQYKTQKDIDISINRQRADIMLTSTCKPSTDPSTDQDMENSYKINYESPIIKYNENFEPYESSVVMSDNHHGKENLNNVNVAPDQRTFTKKSPHHKTNITPYKSNLTSKVGDSRLSIKDDSTDSVDTMAYILSSRNKKIAENMIPPIKFTSSSLASSTPKRNSSGISRKRKIAELHTEEIDISTSNFYVSGKPDSINCDPHISRQNLSLRQQKRRLGTLDVKTCM